ncbi:type IV conjugative transfer system coupling protein TraD (plasmid) [Enterobacter sp. JBIWA003]|uniref:type IV conjugative transfer system coupling protein TraD n=1 Tax=Enterobacter sp. JBIWA003 TaxID=2831890 RepID=UPI001CBDE186|nr:type IV conjugative transfer system coupling protein TraD [Enterobacter sp. JBIWA003]UAN24966.1 type IV conjugative transfer system coupling protein TraD [Enterobacter sp. JBIWA003]
MSLNPRDLTQGGQVAFMRLKMFLQINNLISFYVIMGTVLMTLAVLLMRISIQNLNNGVIYWFVRVLSPFTEKMVRQPVYTIRYYDQNLHYSVRQILSDGYTVYCGQLLKQELVIAGCSALLTAFVATLVVYWYLGRTGRKQSEDEVIGGRVLSDSPKDVARMMKKRGEASDIRIDALPLKLDSEIQNMAMHGTVSTGKSTLMRKIMKQLRDRGDLVIIYDKGCTFVEDFYDESRDEVLNALDIRCPNWDLWEECRTISELENTSSTLIPASSGEDPFWQGSARTIFAEGAERMRKDKDRSYNKFLRTLLAIQLDQLRTFLAGTPASTLVDGKIEKTAISIRSVLTNYVKSLRYLQGIDRPGREKFTIREWMKGQADKSKNGWLFITSDEQNHESLKPLISMWLSIAATSLLAMGPNRQRRVWFFYDELASLHKLPTLPRIISEARKFGGCFVLGFQNFAQMEEIYGPKAAAGLFDLLNTKFFFRSPSAEIAQFVEEDLGETRRLKFSEQTSFGHEQVRDGISFGKEEERVSIVSYSDVQSLNDLQCFVTLPGNYPVVKLTMKYEAMPKSADALLLRDVHTSLDEQIENELLRRTDEERRSMDGLFAREDNSVNQALKDGIPEDNRSNPPEDSDVAAGTNNQPDNSSLQTAGVPTDADTESVDTTTVAGGENQTSTGGTERDIERDLKPRDNPPGVSTDGEVIDQAAFESWQQSQHQTRDMTRREEVNINHAADKTHDSDDGKGLF